MQYDRANYESKYLCIIIPFFPGALSNQKSLCKEQHRITYQLSTMSSDPTNRQRKSTLVPPIKLDCTTAGTPCPISPPVGLLPTSSQDYRLPQLSQQRNILGSGMPTGPGIMQNQEVSFPRPPQRKLSEPLLSTSCKLEQTFPTSTHSFSMVPSYNDTHNGVFAVSIGKSQKLVAPPVSTAIPQLLHLPVGHYHSAQSPTFSDISSIMLTNPWSPATQFTSNDSQIPFIFNKKLPFLPLSSDSNPHLEEMHPSPMIPLPNSISPYLGSTIDIPPNVDPNSASLPSRKRAHSTSSISDFTDVSSIIRASSSSLIALLGQKPSPGFFISPHQTGAIGHLVGQSSPQYTIKERKTSIEQNENFSQGTFDTTITNKITFSERPQVSQAVQNSSISKHNLNVQTAEVMDSMPTCTFTSSASDYTDATSEVPIVCQWNFCCFQFASIHDLVQHLDRTHMEKGIVEEFVCLWRDCPRQRKPFNARYKLVIHMRIHSGEKPNKCTVSNNNYQ